MMVSSRDRLSYTEPGVINTNLILFVYQQPSCSKIQPSVFENHCRKVGVFWGSWLGLGREHAQTAKAQACARPGYPRFG